MNDFDDYEDDGAMCDPNFLSQLDMLESQAIVDDKKENNIPVRDVENLKVAVEDYKRQIERLQEHEMALHGEATMLRQKLDKRQKEVDSSRMEMHKSIDQLNQNHKRKVDELEQQIRGLKSQLHFSEHELEQVRSSRGNFDNSVVMSSQRQPGHNISLVNETREERPQRPEAAGDCDRKWFLPVNSRRKKRMVNIQPSFVTETCCQSKMTLEMECPLSSNSISVHVASESASKSLIRVVDHVKKMLNCNAAIDDKAELIKTLQQLCHYVDFVNSKSNREMGTSQVEACVCFYECIGDFLLDAAIVKHLRSNIERLTAGLYLIAALLRTPQLRFVANVSESMTTRHSAVLRRIFDDVLASLLSQAALDRAATITKPGTKVSQSLRPALKAALCSLSAAAYWFDLIDLQPSLTECPLYSLSYALLQWFESLPSSFCLSTQLRRSCFLFVQMVTRCVTLSSGSLVRFFTHPCHCQPLVTGALAHIGIVSLRSCRNNLESKFNSKSADSILLDVVLGVLLLIELQHTTKSSSRQPIFFVFLAQLAELICQEGSSSSGLRHATESGVRQLLRMHEMVE